MAKFLPVAFHTLFYDPYSIFPLPYANQRCFLPFQCFVYCKEMAHFLELVLRQVGHVLEVVVGRIVKGNCNDLLVPVALVLHDDHPDGVTTHQSHRADLFGTQDQDIQRIPVTGESPGDEAVIGRVVGGGVEDPVQLKQAGLLVQFILHLPPLGDLYDGCEIVAPDSFIVHIMPDIHLIVSFPDGFPGWIFPDGG